jgi:S-formylglutathione hydrolase FrmB
MFIFLGFAAFGATSNWNSKCEKFSQPIDGGYCVHIPDSHRSNDIAYYLHGGGGSEFSWQEEGFYTAQLRKEWSRQNSKLPTVVSISFGETWILVKKNASPHSGLFETVTAKIIPMIEKRLGGLKGRRIVFGESMGGFNSIQLSLRTSMFDKSGVICSPMTEVSPFASIQEIRKHIEGSSAWQYYKNHSPDTVLRSIDEVIQLAKAFYPTQEIWDLADPLNLAKTPRSKSTKVYVAIGFYDRLAAYEANEIFVKSLEKSGVSVDWRPQWGGHCSIDIPSLAAFLTQ